MTVNTLMVDNITNRNNTNHSLPTLKVPNTEQQKPITNESGKIDRNLLPETTASQLKSRLIYLYHCTCKEYISASIKLL